VEKIPAMELGLQSSLNGGNSVMTWLLNSLEEKFSDDVMFLTTC